MVCVAALCLAPTPPHELRVVARKTGRLRAPGSRAEAVGSSGEAEVTTLVVRADGHVRLRASDARGFAWLPGSRASLLYATSGLYGEGGLFL